MRQGVSTRALESNHGRDQPKDLKSREDLDWMIAFVQTCPSSFFVSAFDLLIHLVSRYNVMVLIWVCLNNWNPQNLLVDPDVQQTHVF